MNHLVVSQNSNLEILGNSSNTIGVRIIEKLYELAHAGLDSSSSLSGNLQVSKAYRDSVEWLQQNTGLNIVVTDDYYIKFADSEVARVLTAQYGDGTGVTETAAAAVTSNYNGPYFDHFRQNTDIVTFNELKYFTNLTVLYSKGTYYSPQGMFYACTNLQSIDLSNITMLDGGTFDGCTSLKTLGNFHPTKISQDDKGYNVFFHCESLETIDLSQVPVITAKCFDTCLQLSNINNLNNVTRIDANAFYKCQSLAIDVSLPNYNADGSNDCILPYGAFESSGIISVSNLGKCTAIGGAQYVGRWCPGSLRNCPNLRYIVIPETVTDIQQCSIQENPSMEYIKLYCVVPPTLEDTDPSSSWFPFKNTPGNFYVPDASVNDYKAAAGWSSMASRIFPMSQFSTDFPND